MSNDKPSISIKKQTHTDKPVVGDNTLVDDPVAFTDDPLALVGGMAVIMGNLSQAIVDKAPRASIKKRR